MDLQDIDSVNLPVIDNPPELEIPITRFGLRYHISSFDENSNAHIKPVWFADYGERTNFNFYPYIASPLYTNNTSFFTTGYEACKSFFRLFIDNYATVSSFKLTFKIDSDIYQTGGAKFIGYTPGVETRLHIGASPVNIQTEVVWSTYLALPTTANLIDNVVVTNGVATITFNATGRSLVTGVTAGYVDFIGWVLPSLSNPILEPTGYCLTTSYDTSARLEINY